MVKIILPCHSLFYWERDCLTSMVWFIILGRWHLYILKWPTRINVSLLTRHCFNLPCSGISDTGQDTLTLLIPIMVKIILPCHSLFYWERDCLTSMVWFIILGRWHLYILKWPTRINVSLLTRHCFNQLILLTGIFKMHFYYQCGICRIEFHKVIYICLNRYAIFIPVIHPLWH